MSVTNEWPFAVSGNEGERGKHERAGILTAILVCGGLGTAIAWLVVSPLGLDGVAAGLTTAFAAMIAATLLFACGVALGRALQLFK